MSKKGSLSPAMDKNIGCRHTGQQLMSVVCIRDLKYSHRRVVVV